MEERLLIAGGCSYTDENFRTNAADFVMPEKTWPMWPEHLAKKLNLKHVNVARCGYDNFTIFETVLKSILLNEDKVEAVVVMWSGWDRSILFNVFNLVTLNSFYTNIKKTDEWSNPQWMRDTKFGSAILNYLNSDWWDPYSFIRDSAKNTLSLMYTLATICESRGIKYIFYQGVTPLEFHAINSIERDIERPSKRKYNITPMDVLKEIKKSPYSGQLEKRKKNIIGWPFLPHTGGHFLDHLRGNFLLYFDSPMDLSGMDKHPNAAAQPIIADIFYDQWEKVYG